jgi:glycosyltransferase involved in cell wall biosynthesis
MVHFHPLNAVRLRQRESARTLQRADVLITVSECMRQDIAAFFDWPIDRIVATPLASPEALHPRSPQTLLPSLTWLGLEPEAYVLFVGTIEPRKNIERLLRVYERMPAKLRLRWPLVLAGHHGWNSQHLHAQIQAAQSQGWLRYLGYVPQHRLPELMAGARLFVFPSLYEGFGLQVLEAMASGVPVVSSTASSLPEVCGDAALMHDPQDDEMLLAHLKKGLEDEVWREQARARGMVQAGRFSWARCNEQTLAAYRLAQELA